MNNEFKLMNIEGRLLDLGLECISDDNGIKEFHKSFIDESEHDDEDKLLFVFTGVHMVITESNFMELTLVSRIPEVDDGVLEDVKTDKLTIYTGTITSEAMLNDILYADGLYYIINENNHASFADWAVKLGWASDPGKVKPLSVAEYITNLETKRTNRFLKAGVECIQESLLSDDEKKALAASINIVAKFITSDTLFKVLEDMDGILPTEDDNDDEHVCGCGHDHNDGHCCDEE